MVIGQNKTLTGIDNNPGTEAGCLLNALDVGQIEKAPEQRIVER